MASTLAPTSARGACLDILTSMSDIDSPTLRLIPYLAAITVTIFATLALTSGGESNLLITLVTAAVCYFGTYFIVRFVIALIVRSRSGEREDPDRRA